MTADLFSQINGVMVPAIYPNSAGWKATGTSQEAAENLSEVRQSHKLILKVLETGNYTPEEIADKIGRRLSYTAPRCTELKAQGKLQKSGTRRLNSSGQSANVLCLRQPGGL